MVGVLDSSVLIAAFSRGDANHEAGLAILRAAETGRMPRLVLPDFVLAETLTYLVRKAGSGRARQALWALEEHSGLSVERTPDEAYILAKTELFPRYDGLSFVDCIVAAWAFHRQSREVFAFDRDFDRVPGLKRRTAPGDRE